MKLAHKLTEQTSSAPPSEEEIKLAAQSCRLLATALGEGRSARIRVVDGEQDITIPVSALQMLVDILAHMAQGESITMVPQHAELTTQQAADFLNVSRPFVVKILEQGELAFHKVGSHRRIYFGDLLEYKKRNIKERRAALEELSGQAQDLDLGY